MCIPFVVCAYADGLTSTFVAGDAGGAGSEDCLKVNVYAPAGVKKGSNREFAHDRLKGFRLLMHPTIVPVLVYIHGGGQSFCSSTFLPSLSLSL